MAVGVGAGDVAAQRRLPAEPDRKRGRSPAGNLWEVARDEILREQGWDIRWHFEGHVSQPLKDALDKAKIPYDIEP